MSDGTVRGIVGASIDLYRSLAHDKQFEMLTDEAMIKMAVDSMEHSLEGVQVVARPSWDCCLAHLMDVVWDHDEDCPERKALIEEGAEDFGDDEDPRTTIAALPPEARTRIADQAGYFKELLAPVVAKYRDAGPLLFALTESVVKAHIRAERLEAEPQRPSGGLLPDDAIAKAVSDGSLLIEPFNIHRVQPASYDISLGDAFMVFRHNIEVIDPEQIQDLMHHVVLEPGDTYVLHPNEFILGASVERFRLPPDIAAQLGGKSSLGRLGLAVHATAGFVDPGYYGNITLELSNVANLPIRLRPGMKIGQVQFLRLEAPCERPYGSPGLGSKYVGRFADGVVQSLYHKNVEHHHDHH